MDKWSKEEMQELKKFWQSEVGKKYIKRMEDTKAELFRAAMGSTTPDDAARYVAIANGFDSILQDIKAVVEEVGKAKKEKEGAAEEAK